MPERQATIAETIRSVFESLTRAERQLANALLANYPLSGLKSITALAELAEVSPPTVVRMVKKLGFAGFPDFQSQLRAELEAQISDPIAKHDRWSDYGDGSHILHRFANAVSDNMRQTLAQLDPATFNAVAGLLAESQRGVHVVGGRITRSLADYLFTHLQVTRAGVTLIAPNSNTWPHYVLNMAPGDVLVVFDIRRYEHELVRLVEMATRQGAVVVLFTDQWGSPAARHARHVFNIRVEAPSAWDSSVAILLVVEATIAAVQQATWDTTRQRMRTLEELFDATGLFRKFT